MSRYSYEDIALNFSLWCTYVDPYATTTEEAFKSMTIEQKIALLQKLFGPEVQEEEEAEDF